MPTQPKTKAGHPGIPKRRLCFHTIAIFPAKNQTVANIHITAQRGRSSKLVGVTFIFVISVKREI
jgi:hypothetical protein